MTYKALGLISCTFFLWAISCSFASDYDNTQTLRLFANDAENTEVIPPGSVADQTKNGENAVYGDLDCCQSCCCPRWTVTADAMILDRIGNKSTTILGPLEDQDDHIDDAADRLNSNDFSFPFAAGPAPQLDPQNPVLRLRGFVFWNRRLVRCPIYTPVPQSRLSLVVRLEFQAL